MLTLGKTANSIKKKKKIPHSYKVAHTDTLTILLKKTSNLEASVHEFKNNYKVGIPK